jgi:uncharacterized repeat protein (TIGR04076 family)
MSSVKITVVRRFDKHELFDPLPDELELIPSPCRLEEGMEFVSSGERLPENFCTWAFNDIFRDIIHLMRGGNYPWIGKEGVTYSSCTDGRKTVVFKLERLAP